MNLYLHNQLFIVGGATSGFGKAISMALVAENAKVIAIARSEEQLLLLQQKTSYTYRNFSFRYNPIINH